MLSLPTVVTNEMTQGLLQLPHYSLDEVMHKQIGRFSLNLDNVCWVASRGGYREGWGAVVHPPLIS